jgi:hypothetical protein
MNIVPSTNKKRRITSITTSPGDNIQSGFMLSKEAVKNDPFLMKLYDQKRTFKEKADKMRSMKRSHTYHNGGKQTINRNRNRNRKRSRKSKQRRKTLKGAKRKTRRRK